MAKRNQAQPQVRQQRRGYPNAMISGEQREARREQARRKWAKAIGDVGGRTKGQTADITVRPRNARSAQQMAATGQHASPKEVNQARLSGKSKKSQ